MNIFKKIDFLKSIDREGTLKDR